eukprot:13777481-Alexandrium_andersonii.AAC.1
MGAKEVDAGLRGTPLRWAAANDRLAHGIARVGIGGAAKGLGAVISQTFAVGPRAAVCLSSGL